MVTNPFNLFDQVSQVHNNHKNSHTLPLPKQGVRKNGDSLDGINYLYVGNCIALYLPFNQEMGLLPIF